MRKVDDKKIILFFPDPKLEGLTWHRMPFSVLAVSSFLVANGYNVRIFDERFETDLERKITEASKDALCVGISAFTGNQLAGALRVAQAIRKELPDKPLIWGGWHPSIFPEQTAEDPNVDIAVYGQGERTFFELVEAISKNKPIDDIPGLCYEKDGRIVKSAPRPLEDISNFPAPPLHLINVRNYVGPHDGLDDAMTLSYMSSQGCPHRCGFCADKRVYQRRWFGLKPERVIGDITKLVKEYDLKAIYFEDNNFFVNKTRVEEICKGIIANGLNIKWEAMGHPRYLAGLNDDFWDLIRKSGCSRILIGAESGDQKILDLINKDSDVKDTVSFVEKTKKHGIIPILSTLVGFPGSARQDFFRTIDMVVKLKRSYIEAEWKLFIYTPYPGTDLYDNALKFGMREPVGLLEWSRHTLRDVRTPWIDDKFKTDIRNVAFFYFQVAYPSRFIWQKVKHVKPGFIVKPAFWLVQLLARIRLRLNFYRIPVEPFVYNLVKKRWIR